MNDSSHLTPFKVQYGTQNNTHLSQHTLNRLHRCTITIDSQTHARTHTRGCTAEIAQKRIWKKIASYIDAYWCACVYHKYINKYTLFSLSLSLCLSRNVCSLQVYVCCDCMAEREEKLNEIYVHLSNFYLATSKSDSKCIFSLLLLLQLRLQLMMCECLA